MGKRKTFRKTKKTMGGGLEEEILRNFFTEGRDRYKKLGVKEIQYCSSEKNKKVACPTGSCKKAGKSEQIVSICLTDVHKLQPLVSGTVKSKGDSDSVLAIDSFNMNFLQQHITQHITKKLNGEGYSKNIEHYEEVEYLKARETTADEKGSKIYTGNETTGIAFKYLKSSDTFENFLLNDKNYTVEQIVDILETIFEVNDVLYGYYQFQHCDMKCAQILLSISGDGDSKVITPILSDFDKSTCTININGKPVRIRLTKGDAHNQSSTMWSMGKGYYFKSQQKKFENSEPGEMSDKIQELERFKDMPLASNKFYNVCLLASTLLLIKEDIFDIFILRDELSEYMKFINIGKNIKELRKREKKRKEEAKEKRELDKYKNGLTGNKEAASCVNLTVGEENLLKRAETLNSSISLEDLENLFPPIVVEGTIVGGKKKKRKTKKRRKTKKKRS